MTRREFASAALGAAVAPRKRPNILLILPDQLRAQSLGCYGDPNVLSPNIDRLASAGLRFRNTIANTPVCCPARANILTGRYAHRNGMTANDLRLRESEVTLSSLLRDAGYRTGFIGKWHLDGGPRMPGFVPPGPRRHGFDFWAANECSHAHFNTQYFRDSPEPIPMRKFEAQGWTDIALDFLREQAGAAKPFFLTVQMGPPHDPYLAPPEFGQLYDPASLRLPATYDEAAVPRENIAQYYGMVSAVDAQVGRMLDELDTLKMAEDTIVLFTSDHGDMLGAHGERLKRKPWEESIRVPGLLRYPKLAARGVRNQFLTHVDMAPTLLGLCGLPVPASMQGRNVLAPGAVPATEAFLQIFGPFRGDGTEAGWRGLRTAQHTYARYQDRPWVLYDNVRDPLQQQNRVVEDKAIAALLDRRLAAWMRRTGDSWSNNWTFPVEDGGRLYNDRAYYSVNEYLNGPDRRVIDLAGGKPERAVIFYATQGVPSHAFVALEREDERGHRTRVEAWGFYPDPAVSTARAVTRTVRGVVLDEVLGTKALPRVVESVVIYITDRQWDAVRGVIDKWRCNGSYRLLDHDCITFVDEVARTLGLQTPPRRWWTNRPLDYIHRVAELN